MFHFPATVPGYLSIREDIGLNLLKLRLRRFLTPKHSDLNNLRWKLAIYRWIAINNVVAQRRRLKFYANCKTTPLLLLFLGVHFRELPEFASLVAIRNPFVKKKPMYVKYIVKLDWNNNRYFDFFRWSSAVVRNLFIHSCFNFVSGAFNRKFCSWPDWVTTNAKESSSFGITWAPARIKIPRGFCVVACSCFK